MSIMAAKLHLLALTILILTPEGYQQSTFSFLPLPTKSLQTSANSTALSSGQGTSSSTVMTPSTGVMNASMNSISHNGNGATTVNVAVNNGVNKNTTIKLNSVPTPSAVDTTNIPKTPIDTNSQITTSSSAFGGIGQIAFGLPQWMALLQGVKPESIRGILSELGVGANSTQSHQLSVGLSGMMQEINPDTLNKIISTLGIGSNSTGQSQHGNVASGPVQSAIPDLSGLLSMFGMGANSSQGIVGVAQQVFSALQGVGQAASDPSVSPRCRDDLSSFTKALQSTQLWALQMLDAMGKPRAGLMKGQLTLVGDYNECLDINQPMPDHVIQGQFCRLQVQTNFSSLGGLASLQTVLRIVMVHVCVPKSCSPNDLATVLKPAFDATKGLGKLAEPPVCDLGLQDPTEDTTFWIAIGITSFLALLCAIGTLYAEILDRRVAAADKRGKRTAMDTKNGDVNGHVNAGFQDEENKADGGAEEPTSVVTSNGEASAHDAAGVHKFTVADRLASDQSTPNRHEEGTCSRLLSTFSVLKNGSKLLSCGQTQGELSCLHGLRVLSITWVLLGHSFTMVGSSGTGMLGNPSDMFPIFSRWSMAAVYAGTLSVDTFFLLSGCLTCYLFLRQTKKAGGITCFHMVMYYVHRFWRLTPLYMFTIVIYVGITPYIQTGPFAFGLMEGDNCRKYWWHNLLYINNLVGTKKMCFGASWYLADDMQFYWIAPLVLVPLALKYRAVGLMLSGLLVLCQIVSVNVINHISGTHNFLGDALEYMDKVYLPPWNRVGTFAIGLMLGYALDAYDCKFKMQKMSVLLGWLVALATGLTCVYVIHDDVKDLMTSFQLHGKWTVDEAGLYEAFSRPLWACAVAWVVFACCTGYGGFVNTFLSWKAWAPLSRLTYGVYLFHLVIFMVMMHNRTEPFYLSSWNVMVQFLALTVLSFMVSFVTSLLVESPTLGVEKILLGGAARRKKN